MEIIIRFEAANKGRKVIAERGQLLLARGWEASRKKKVGADFKGADNVALVSGFANMSICVRQP